MHSSINRADIEAINVLYLWPEAGYERPSHHPSGFINNCIVAYEPDAQRWLCKQRPLLSNGRKNRKGLHNPFLTNGSVNTPPQ
jgi:hypothetical protein